MAGARPIGLHKSHKDFGFALSYSAWGREMRTLVGYRIPLVAMWRRRVEPSWEAMT